MQTHWLHDFLYREDNFKLVSDAVASGWLDGGCLILADALAEWLGEGAEPYFLIGSSSGADGKPVDWPEHALVRYGDLYLDGDGASSEDVLLQRWAEQEGVEEGWLTPATNELRERGMAGGIPEDAAVSHEMAQRLTAEFVVIPWLRPLTLEALQEE
jgi:hypothetical protein